jgi:hypothetical protein
MWQDFVRPTLIDILLINIIKEKPSLSISQKLQENFSEYESLYSGHSDNTVRR